MLYQCLSFQLNDSASAYKKKDKYSWQILRARRWLKKLWNREVKLISETINLKGSFWLHSDNYIAYEALEDSYPGFARRLYQSLMNYGYQHDSWYELAFEGNLEVFPFQKGEAIVLVEGKWYQVKSWDYSSGEVFDDFEGYADLCMLKSIHSWIQGECEDSLYYIEKAESYWDGTGFKDGSWTNCYDTYKLGLFIATCKIVEYKSNLEEIIEKTIWSLQDIKSGGIWSHFSNIGEHWEGSQQTVEATAMCILAYKQPF